MNGEGREEGEKGEKVVYMWGYLPGALPQRSPILSPVVVRPFGNEPWRDVSGGGCGFAMAISDAGKLITWGSSDDLGQSYLTSGKHGKLPSSRLRLGGLIVLQLPIRVKFTLGDGKSAYLPGRPLATHLLQVPWRRIHLNIKIFSLQIKVILVFLHAGSATSSGTNGRARDEATKRRRISLAKQAGESSTSGEETLSALPCLVTLNPGIRIVAVAAGGRHSLVLSDMGQVWGWGYGGEGQLGLGSRIRMVSSPHPIPCVDSSFGKDRSFSRGTMTSEGQGYRFPGTYVKSIACGGRHSAVITDAGALLTFGWGLYGQCGQGSTDDELAATCVSSLLGIQIEAVSAGLWHTVCLSADGDVYAFGGNQFGQLGTGGDQAETLPRLLEAASIEDVNAKVVSCGARHTAVITEDGKVFCWGWNKYGQLGLGDVIDRNVPSRVTIDGPVPRNIACGWWHTLLLAESPT